MKWIRYIMFVLVFNNVWFSYACYYPTYTPGEYFVFYSYDEKEKREHPSSSDINIHEWREYTSDKAGFDDIYRVVYKYTVHDMEYLATGNVPDTGEIAGNTFVKFLLAQSDREAVNYLMLAKKCEAAREKRADKWWYPTKDDMDNKDLAAILEEALDYNGKVLRLRYLLQAMRAAFTMQQYDLCLKLWDEQIKDLPESSVKNMCEDYIGGIYFRRGDYQTAIVHYANTMQTSGSFWWCVDVMAEKKSDINRIKMLYEYHPNSPELAVMVQKVCREAENRANSKVFDGYTDEYKDVNDGNSFGYNSYRKNRERYVELRDFALQVASGNRTDNPAMWQYTAAFLTLLDGKPGKAADYISKAKRMKGTDFIKNNVRVLGIMLEAYNGKYDRRFEARILPELQWLEQMTKVHLTPMVKDDYEGNDDMMFSNFSMYYFNDMMRKIMLSIMAPRYIERKKEVKALMLAGMSSEHMRTLTDYRQYVKNDPYKRKYNIDFYTDVFSAMDTLPVESIIEYSRKLKSGGNNKFERFLLAGCYRNADYLNEIIATRYLRLEQYEKAIEYLTQVSPEYDSTLNLYNYFDHDPFEEPFYGIKFIKPAPGYKLKFAIKMLDLQRLMSLVVDPEIRSVATYYYALGLMRSVTDCWSLTRYRRGYLYGNYQDDRFSVWGENIRHRSQELIKEVLASTDDYDLQAKCITANIWHTGQVSYEYRYDDLITEENELALNHYIALLLNDKYVRTDVVSRLMSECDNYYTYFEKVETSR